MPDAAEAETNKETKLCFKKEHCFNRRSNCQNGKQNGLKNGLIMVQIDFRLY